MNKLDFTVKQGFPFTESTVEFMHGMMLQLQFGSLLGGNNYILSGCTESGGVVSNGWVVISGEILPFVGGPVSDTVIVTDIPTQKEFFGGESHDYYHERKATFGIGETNYDWSDFTRNDPANGVLARLDKVEKMLKPLLGYTVGGNTVYGSWLFWGRPASEIPAGWEAVPDADWKGRVPVVLDTTQTEFDTVGKVGGEKTHLLLDTEMTHRHTISTEENGTDGTTSALMFNDSDSGDFIENSLGPTMNTDYIGHTSGTRDAHNNLQPYKVVLFIRFVG